MKRPYTVRITVQKFGKNDMCYTAYYRWFLFLIRGRWKRITPIHFTNYNECLCNAIKHVNSIGIYIGQES